MKMNMKMNLCFIYATLFLCCVLLSTQSQAQQKPLSIHFAAPTQLFLGESVKLKVQVKHQLNQEKTGTLQFALYNADTKKSVDGWFLNFFPFQYFTTIKNEIFETEFPFTVPNDYKGKFTLELVAKVDTIQDSIRIDIPTFIKQ
ncbi:MAG: hypothetical protein ACOYKI_00585 [Sediminibacterium sp.]